MEKISHKEIPMEQQAAANLSAPADHTAYLAGGVLAEYSW
jgi:hypothetical protein